MEPFYDSDIANAGILIGCCFALYTISVFQNLSVNFSIFWDIFGYFWGTFRVFFEFLGYFWGHLGLLRATLGLLWGYFLANFEVLLGCFWGASAKDIAKDDAKDEGDRY